MKTRLNTLPAAVTISLLPLMLAPAAQAQQTQPTTLAPVLVEGFLPREARRLERQAELDQRAGGTSITTADAYLDGRATTLSDTLRFTPGVVAQTRHGEETRFSMRGSGLQRGFLLRGIQLYQDGIPLNHADGAGDFQSIDPLAVEMIETWRGANALEYGANSLGGAINFVSPTGRTADRAAARLQLGSFGQRLGHASIAGANENTDGFLSLTHGRQDGYRDQSQTRATRVFGNVGQRFSETLEARVFLGYVDTALAMPGSLTRAAMDVDPRQAAQNYERLDARNDYRMRRLAAQLSWTPSSSTRWTTTLHHSGRDRFHAMTFGTIDQKAIDNGVDTRGVMEFGSAEWTRRLVLGASLARHRSDENRFTNSNGNSGAQTGSNRLVAHQYSVYGEYSHGLTTQLTGQLGLQATRAERKLVNRWMPAGSYDKDFSAFNPKAGLIFALSADSQLYGNVSRSFEAPPFGELIVRPVYPLADAQRATTVELGYRKRVGKLWIDAALYNARIKGELLALNDANGVALGTVNAGRTVHRGIEFGASLPLAAPWRARVNYLFNDFRFDSDPVYGNNRLAGVAPHLLQAEIRWQVIPQLYLAPVLELRAGKTYIDHANTVSIGSATTLNLTVGGDIDSHLSWFVEGRNLTDKRYAGGTSVVADAQGRDGAYYFPADGRAVYAGVNWRM